MWKAEIYKAKLHAINYLMKHNRWKEFLRKLLYLATSQSWAQLTNVGIYIRSPCLEITLNAISKESELLKGEASCDIWATNQKKGIYWEDIELSFEGGWSVGFVGTLKQERSQVAKQTPYWASIKLGKHTFYSLHLLYICFIHIHIAVCLLFL